MCHNKQQATVRYGWLFGRRCTEVLQEEWNLKRLFFDDGGGGGGLFLSQRGGACATALVCLLLVVRLRSHQRLGALPVSFTAAAAEEEATVHHCLPPPPQKASF